MLDEESQPELFGSRKRTGRLARERRTKLCPFTVYFIHPFPIEYSYEITSTCSTLSPFFCRPVRRPSPPPLS